MLLSPKISFILPDFASSSTMLTACYSSSIGGSSFAGVTSVYILLSNLLPLPMIGSCFCCAFFVVKLPSCTFRMRSITDPLAAVGVQLSTRMETNYCFLDSVSKLVNCCGWAVKLMGVVSRLLLVSYLTLYLILISLFMLTTSLSILSGCPIFRSSSPFIS